MKAKLEKVYSLFSNYAKDKEANVCVNNDFCQCIVLDHQRILTYHFPAKNEISGFLMMEPFVLENEMFFSIEKSKLRWDFFLELKTLDTIKEFHVLYDEKKETQNLVEALFNDFETKAILDQYFDKKFELYYENNTLSLRASYPPCEGDFTFTYMTVDKLNQMNFLFEEIKKSFLFHSKRV